MKWSLFAKNFGDLGAKGHNVLNDIPDDILPIDTKVIISVPYTNETKKGRIAGYKYELRSVAPVGIVHSGLVRTLLYKVDAQEDRPLPVVGKASYSIRFFETRQYYHKFVQRGGNGIEEIYQKAIRKNVSRRKP